MTKTIRSKKIFLRLFIIPVAALFILSAFVLPDRNKRTVKKHADKSPVYDSIVVNKFSENKKYKIRLFPDAYKQVLLISAEGKQNKDYRFFMFDMDGKLINEADIHDRETTVFEDVEKGNYLFEIFNNDERVENGNLIIK
jgi:hypothetical protein